MDIDFSTLPDGTSHLRVTGDIDLATADMVRQAVALQLGFGRRTLQVDLADVTFIDYYGLRVVLAALADARAAGGRARLGALSRPVLTVLRITGRTELPR